MKPSADISAALSGSHWPTLQYADRRVFVANLRFSHGLMLATEDMLGEAIVHSPVGRLREYFQRHLEEETGHVKMLEGDLAFLGEKPQLDYRAGMLAGLQLYLIRHFGAQFLLGYMYVLESRAPSPELVAQLAERYGDASVRCMAWHARYDPQHVREILVEIGMLSDPAPVWGNAVAVSQALGAFLSQLERAS